MKAPHLPAQSIDLDAYLADIEKDLIAQALILSSGQKKRAAELLRINRTTLLARMKWHGFKLLPKRGAKL